MIVSSDQKWFWRTINIPRKFISILGRRSRTLERQKITWHPILNKGRVNCWFKCHPKLNLATIQKPFFWNQTLTRYPRIRTFPSEKSTIVRKFCSFRTVAKFAVSDFNISFIAHESCHTWRINKTSWVFRVDLSKLCNIIKSIFQSSWMCIDPFNGKLYKSDSWSSRFRRRIYPRINRLRKYIRKQ